VGSTYTNSVNWLNYPFRKQTNTITHFDARVAIFSISAFLNALQPHLRAWLHDSTYKIIYFIDEDAPLVPRHR
jgi:hypothetical protein